MSGASSSSGGVGGDGSDGGDGNLFSNWTVHLYIYEGIYTWVQHSCGISS